MVLKENAIKCKSNNKSSISDLRSNIRCALVDDDLVNFAELPEVFVTSENLSITESRGKTNDKDEIFLYNSTQQIAKILQCCANTFNFLIFNITQTW